MLRFLKTCLFITLCLAISGVFLVGFGTVITFLLPILDGIINSPRFVPGLIFSVTAVVALVLLRILFKQYLGKCLEKPRYLNGEEMQPQLPNSPLLRSDAAELTVAQTNPRHWQEFERDFWRFVENQKRRQR